VRRRWRESKRTSGRSRCSSIRTVSRTELARGSYPSHSQSAYIKPFCAANLDEVVGRLLVVIILDKQTSTAIVASVEIPRGFLQGSQLDRPSPTRGAPSLFVFDSIFCGDSNCEMPQVSLRKQTHPKMLPPRHTDQVLSRTAARETLQKFVGTHYFLMTPIRRHFFILL